MSDLEVQFTDITPADQANLRSVFLPFEEGAKAVKEQVYAIKVTDPSQKQEMAQARQYRLKLKDLRVSAEHAKKREKEESLKKGKAIDAVFNYILSIIEPMEEHLQEQEDFVTRMEEAEEAARLLRRRDKILAAGADPSFYNLKDMSEDIFEKVLNECLMIQLKKVEEAAKQEEERIAKEKAAAEERERMRLENERLKAEAEAREKVLAEEREKARVERERIESEQRQKDIDAAAALKVEREAKEKVEAEFRAEEEKQAAAMKAEEDRLMKIALAPEKEKLMIWAGFISSIVPPEVQTPQAKEILAEGLRLLSSASEYIKTASINL